MARGKAEIRMLVIPNSRLAELGCEAGPGGYMVFIARVDDDGQITPLLAFTNFEMIDEFIRWLRKFRAEMESRWQQREASKMSLTIAEVDAFLISQKL